MSASTSTNGIFENHSLLRRTSVRERSRMCEIWSSHVATFADTCAGVSMGRVLSLPDGSPTSAV